MRYKITEHYARGEEKLIAAFNKLKSGKGNIISRTEKLKVLGAKAKKSISNDLLDDSGQLSIETEIDA